MPNNWKTYKLSDFIDINPLVKLKANESYSFVEMKDLDANNRTVLPSNFKSLNGGARFQNDDTLFARITPCLQNGKICQVKGLKENVGFGSTEFLVFRGKKGVSDTNFVYYLSREPFFRQFAENNMIGTSGRQRVAKQAFQNIELELPPLQEQQSIASILSAIDDKIENNLAINKTLEEMAMALYKHWFVDFGPFQDGEFVQSELGMIPKGWEVKKICDVVSVIGGYAFKSKWFQETGIKVLKIKNINNNIVDISKCDCISETVSKSINPKFKVSKGDFLVAMTGAEVGKVGVVPNYQQDLWLNQRVGKFNDKEIKNASILIGKVMQTNDFYKIIQGLAYGSAQPNISTSDIENINIILPNDKNILNTLINDFVHLHNITIENLTENQTLTQLRDTLLPQLISGAVRLKEFREY
ncbi:restriction endonuclease subunit S [Flavobacterium sp.]|uniref:restriction endonuclease subunit S n=1 Tax=Flavobacterium sp. TaxID=239 RepID=UPI0025B9D29D|nr:restriction endonuclease subunit S [Flavobacterium sp.]MBA4275987.1 restriction endonuclease subunit S [Flavobacterium sp.]